MSEINKLFNIENYNLIQDEQYYYLFRALNNGDHSDLESGITRDENGKIIQVRTDRDRYIENPDNGNPRYDEDDQMSLMQAIDHIKEHHRIDTNCISLSSNANVSVMYGNGYYHDEYAVIRVPKDEVGSTIINASEYMLDEIEKRIQDAITEASANPDDNEEILELINQIDNAENSKELSEIVSTSYTLNTQNSTTYTGKANEARTKKATRQRFSQYEMLTDEQNLAKNKVVAKITILEHHRLMKPIMPHTVRDSKVFEALGNAFSSSELINYGRIDGSNLFETSKEFIHILGLLQQTSEKRPELASQVSKMEREIIEYVLDGYTIEEKDGQFVLKSQDTERVLGDNYDKLDAFNPQMIPIQEAYKLTDGKISYEDVGETVEKIFYLSKSITKARNYSSILETLTKNNPEYAEVINHITTNGIDIEPKVMNKKNASRYKISESVSIGLAKNEEGLVEGIQNISTPELEHIISAGGITTNPTISKSLTNLQDSRQMPENEYYARAVFSLYDWESDKIHFSEAQKEQFIEKISAYKINDMYENLKKAGINEDKIPQILLNLITLDKKEIIQNIEQGNITDEIIATINNEEGELQQQLQVSQLEDYLEFYKVEGTDIKLRDYQKSAVDKTNKIFETHKYASVILPTGAGKSFVALAELMQMQQKINQNANEQILYLAPSQEILSQIMKYTRKYIVGEKLGQASDEEIFRQVFPNVKLATYQSLLTKTDEELQSEKYRFMVLDELHRTGAQEWGKKLDTLLDAQDDNLRVLGITATPERDADNRNMSDEIALKLGYTEEQVKNGEHIAKKMDLIDAIRLGIVVNPRIVECEYNLKNDTERWENLLKKITGMDDGSEKDEYIKKYDDLRKKLGEAKEIPELFRDSITKKDGRYIFYMPIGSNEYVEDEDGNATTKKSGEEKVKESMAQLQEWLKYVDAEPEFYSMLGEYGNSKNAEQLDKFEKSKSNHIKIMIVMNKLNEGVHVEGINGIIWQRALDENSRILLLQQLGRAIYSLDEDSQIDEENRPLVIDLPNNLTRVDLQKVINTYTEIDDVEMLTNVLDWIEQHKGILPDINSSSKEESGMASTLKRIQGKYIKYMDDEEFEKLGEDKVDKIEHILEMGSEIDLWDIELPEKEKKNKQGEQRGGKIDFEDVDFSLKGSLKDFVELENEVNEINNKGAVEIFIDTLKKLQKIGVDVTQIKGRDTIGSLAKKSGVSEEKLQEIGMDANKRLNFSGIKSAYRGKGDHTPPTPEQVKEIEALGLSLEVQNSTQDFIDTLKELKEIGVDVTQIINSDTIGSLAKKSGVSEEKLQEIGMDANKRLNLANIKSAHRGKGHHTPPTPEQVKEIEALGLSLEVQNVTQDFIDTLKELKEIGVDVTQIINSDTIGSLAEKSGISEEKLQEIGMDANKKLNFSGIKSAYRGKYNYTPPTPDQVKEIEALGLSLEVQNATQDFIDTLKELKEIGADVTQIKGRDTIGSLAKKSGVSEEKLQEIGMDANKNLNFANIKKAYRGKGGLTPPTPEQVKEIEALGLSLEVQNATQDFIDTLKELKEIGVDVTQINSRDTIGSLAEKSGISEEKLQEIGMDANKKLNFSSIKKAYRGKGTSTPPTPDQVKEIEALGLSLEKKKISTQSIGQATFDSPASDTVQAEQLLTDLKKQQKNPTQTQNNNDLSD